MLLQGKEDAIVAKDLLEVEIRKRKGVSLTKAAHIDSLMKENELARLSLDQKSADHQVICSQERYRVPQKLVICQIGGSNLLREVD